MAGIIHILRQDDTASSPGFFPSASPSFLLARVAKRGKKFIRKVFTASFLPPFARPGGGGREREEDSRRLTLSAQLRANFLFAIFLSARRFVATSVKRNEVEMVPRVENNSD